MDPVVIIGSGLAGYSVLRELRRKARELPIVMVTAEDGAYYSKPALSSALADRRMPADLVLNTAEQMGRATRARILTETPVLAIDPRERRVRIAGDSLPYSSLVLALGSTPLRPALAGNGAADVLHVNSLADYRLFRERLHSAARVVLFGAGLIGCEFANDLAAAGVTVDVVEAAPQALPRLLPPQAATSLQQRLEAIGVHWHLGMQAVAVDRAATGYAVALSDGSTVRGDLVLSAIGLRPNASLAQEAGLRVNRGIVTDRLLATSEAGIYAIGDCAEVDGLVLPFVAPISIAARALASTLSGTPSQVCYPAMPIIVKTPCWPTVVSPAPIGAQGSWECVHSTSGMRSLMHGAAGALLGFALNGPVVAEADALARDLPPLLA